MLFQAPTMLYAFLWHIVPYFFSDYGPWAEYYMRVLTCFICINGVANWLCVILYDPAYRKSKDNPFLQVGGYEQPPDQFVPMIEQSSANGNGHCVYDISNKEALPWEYCKDCEMYIPPRCHHCKICKRCILKRDHHCYMVGNCIGFKNQRYFAVLAFYAMVTGLVGAYFTFKYIKLVVWPQLDSWAYLFFPVAMWKSLFGVIPGFHVLLLVHLPLEIFFGFIGFVYVTSQLTVIASGKTLHELAKQVPVKSTLSMNKHFRSVFGDFWALNFLFPMTLIFRQSDDGVHWDGIKIDHNGNEKKSNGDFFNKTV